MIRLSQDGRRVVQMAMAIPVHCEPDGVTILIPLVYGAVPVATSRAFQDSVEGSDPEGSLKSSVTGRFNQSMTAVTTTWNATITLTGATGTNTCSSGAISVTATR